MNNSPEVLVISYAQRKAWIHKSPVDTRADHAVRITPHQVLVDVPEGGERSPVGVRAAHGSIGWVREHYARALDCHTADSCPFPLGADPQRIPVVLVFSGDLSAVNAAAVALSNQGA